jgi:aspartate/methionine/tyrosine aminotransferase
MRRFRHNDIISLVGAAPRYDLGESMGGPDIRLGDLLDDSGRAGVGELPLGYGTAAGDPRLRRAIATAHGVSAEDVVVTVGGMHALFLIAFILCDRGDEAVAASPLFPPARGALDVVGARVRTLPLAFDRGYRLDPDDLREHLSPATRLVSLAAPQNPSGVAIPRNTLRDVLALMQEKCPEAYLLVDETFREATYGDNPAAPSAVTLGTRVISVASLSKCHGAPGLRTGWAITKDTALAEQLTLGKFNTVVSGSPVHEALALDVLERRGPVVAERRRNLADGLAMTADWVLAHQDLVEWVPPDAGGICCVRLRRPPFDEAAVSRFYRALESGGVRVANGTWFGEEARVFRLGFGLLSTSDLSVALKAVGAALAQTVDAGAGPVPTTGQEQR